MLGHKDASITLKFYAKHTDEKSVKRASFLDEVEVTEKTVWTQRGHKLDTVEKSEEILKFA